MVSILNVQRSFFPTWTFTKIELVTHSYCELYLINCRFSTKAKAPTLWFLLLIERARLYIVLFPSLQESIYYIIFLDFSANGAAIGKKLSLSPIYRNRILIYLILSFPSLKLDLKFHLFCTRISCKLIPFLLDLNVKRVQYLLNFGKWIAAHPTNRYLFGY